MKIKLPVAPSARIDGVSCDLSPAALEKWNPQLRAKKSDVTDIEVFGVIGFDPWTGEGITVASISDALRKAGDNSNINLNINSPGGDMFEGLAIYNTLREHKGDINVKVLGLAASAASIIAMAGDNVQIARGGFLMIHNAWTIAAGNRHDFRAMSDKLEPFDRAMADIYSVRSVLEADEIAGMMDAETWLGGSEAVDKGFADSLLDSDLVISDPSAKAEAFAARKIEHALGKAGLPRSECRKLMAEFRAGKRDAAGPNEEGKRDAAIVNEILSLARELHKGIAS